MVLLSPKTNALIGKSANKLCSPILPLPVSAFGLIAPEAGLCTRGPAVSEEFALVDRIARTDLSEKTFMSRASTMEKEQRELSGLF